MQRCSTWCTSCSSCTEIEKPRKRTCATSCGVSWNKDLWPKRIIPYQSHHCRHILEKWRHIEDISTRPRHLHFAITLFNKQTPDSWVELGDGDGFSINNSSVNFLHSCKTSTSTHGHIQRTRKRRKIIKQAHYHNSKLINYGFHHCLSRSAETNCCFKSYLQRAWQTEDPKIPVCSLCEKGGGSSVRIIALIRTSSMQTIFIMRHDCHANYCGNAQVTGFFAASRALALPTLVCFQLLVLSCTETKKLMDCPQKKVLDQEFHNMEAEFNSAKSH